MDTDTQSSRKFEKATCLVVGVFSALIAAMMFHYTLGDSTLLKGMNMPYLPYLLAFFVGTCAFSFLRGIKQTETNIDSE